MGVIVGILVIGFFVVGVLTMTGGPDYPNP